MNKKMILLLLAIIVLVVVIVFIATAVTQKNSLSDNSAQLPQTQNETTQQKSETTQTTKNNMHIITIKTNLGSISFETYDADAPLTVKNFITLAEKGFYDNVIFHRIIKGFMIQGGDPTGTGTGGPGYSFKDELNSETESYKEGYKRGVVAMANAGPNTNGSQFFIMLQDTPLPHNYTIFGKITAGQDVVDAIGNLKTDSSDRPLDPPVIESVSVETKN